MYGIFAYMTGWFFWVDVFLVNVPAPLVSSATWLENPRTEWRFLARKITELNCLFSCKPCLITGGYPIWSMYDIFPFSLHDWMFFWVLPVLGDQENRSVMSGGDTQSYSISHSMPIYWYWKYPLYQDEIPIILWILVASPWHPLKSNIVLMGYPLVI